MGLPQFTKPLKWQVKCERWESILTLVLNLQWIPAFAGMTVQGAFNDELIARKLNARAIVAGKI